MIETRACGEKVVELDILKKITEFSGTSSESALVKRFWRVLKSFDDDQRQLYLKFVFGRSRLPSDMGTFKAKHRVDFARQMKENALPQAHTCFFSIDMPHYSTDKKMREKLLTAITLCGEIDTDGTAVEDFNGVPLNEQRRRFYDNYYDETYQRHDDYDSEYYDYGGGGEEEE